MGARRLATILFAWVLVLAVGTPAFGYGKANVEHLRLQRLDLVQCSTPIGIVATLTDQRGDPISGVTVSFALSNGEPGDVLSSTTSVTNSLGQATTSLSLSCLKGPRTVRASVPTDGVGGNVRASITFVCGESQGCTTDTHEADSARNEYEDHDSVRVVIFGHPPADRRL